MSNSEVQIVTGRFEKGDKVVLVNQQRDMYNFPVGPEAGTTGTVLQTRSFPHGRFVAVQWNDPDIKVYGNNCWGILPADTGYAVRESDLRLLSTMITETDLMEVLTL